MIGKLFFTAIGAAALAGTIAVAQAKTSSSPLMALQLKGHWVCTQGAGGTYNEDWSPVFGGLWIRATDSAKGATTGEHTVTFDKPSSTWIVLDAFATGAYDVLHGTGTSTHIVFHAAYPKPVLNVIFNRTSATQYTIDVNGAPMGKKISTHSVCVRH